MIEYAARVGARFQINNGRRCGECGHVNSRFIVKGGQRLCQVCFAKWVRF